MTRSLKKYLPEIAGVVIGGIGGFLYWKYVGCLSGTCAIKSNWYLMIPWGMILGYLAGAVAKDIYSEITQRKKKDNI